MIKFIADGCRLNLQFALRRKLNCRNLLCERLDDHHAAHTSGDHTGARHHWTRHLVSDERAAATCKPQLAIAREKRGACKSGGSSESARAREKAALARPEKVGKEFARALKTPRTLKRLSALVFCLWETKGACESRNNLRASGTKHADKKCTRAERSHIETRRRVTTPKLPRTKQIFIRHKNNTQMT